MRDYLINEIFYTLQGEGIRAGGPSVFIRFSKCNLKCAKETHGFDCDTEFESGTRMDLDALLKNIKAVAGDCHWVVLTGGEPALQVDEDLVTFLHQNDFRIAVETNGTIELPDYIDWITVSPKTAEHTLRQKSVSELKYVRHVGQAIPKPVLEASYYLLSPAWDESIGFGDNLQWCIDLVKENPIWRLSCQQHKWWGVR